MMLLALSTALGSEIQVTAARPVVVAIDGRPAGVAGTLIDTLDLQPGTHKVQVRNFIGSLLAEAAFELADGELLRLTYDRGARTLTELDRAPLECVPNDDRTCSPQISSLVVTGLSDISGLARVMGKELPFDSDVQGFLAEGIDTSLVEVHLEDNEQLRFHGAIQLEAGRHTACHLLYKVTAWLLECEAGDVARPAPVSTLPR